MPRTWMQAPWEIPRPEYAFPKPKVTHLAMHRIWGENVVVGQKPDHVFARPQSCYKYHNKWWDPIHSANHKLGVCHLAGTGGPSPTEGYWPEHRTLTGGTVRGEGLVSVLNVEWTAELTAKYLNQSSMILNGTFSPVWSTLIKEGEALPWLVLNLKWHVNLCFASILYVTLG